jgi:UPF0755 protein
MQARRMVGPDNMRRIGCAVAVLVVLASLLAAVGIIVPMLAARAYGPPSSQLDSLQVWQYSARLLWADGLLTKPLAAGTADVEFEVQPGEPVDSICQRLARAGIARDAWIVRDYLIYTGLDTSVQAGVYQLSASMSAIDLARRMQDATPADIDFVVLPGWRLEEIAASLPTSGLDIEPAAFIAAVAQPQPRYDLLDGANTAEGFLYPDSYMLPRTTDVVQLVESLISNFRLHLDADLQEGFARQGLSVYQAVTLASIVQRESVHADEAPEIASVYLNRLAAGMPLDADPTVQYALGYNESQSTWWTNPLSLEDLKQPSPYNTYLNDGLPPSPIANPGMSALRAVAFPADTPYYFFAARCDGSGYHDFAETFEQHLQNLCP